MSDQDEQDILQVLSHIDQRFMRAIWSVLVFAVSATTMATAAWVSQQNAIDSLRKRADVAESQAKELTSAINALNATLRESMAHDADQSRRLDRLEEK